MEYHQISCSHISYLPPARIVKHVVISLICTEHIYKDCVRESYILQSKRTLVCGFYSKRFASMLKLFFYQQD